MNDESGGVVLLPFYHSSFIVPEWSGNLYRKKMGADFGRKGTDTSQGTILFLWRPETQIVKHGMLEETPTDCKDYLKSEW